jgi:glycerol uptake facilitator-like aquaporin
MNPLVAEFIGTAVLVTFGNGVVANVVPMTNPMRRQADLYNQALFLQGVSLDMGEGAAMASLLNLRMKAVAKIQRETHLLHFMEQRRSFEADGVVYRMEPGLETNRWFVYLDLGAGVGGLFSSYTTTVVSGNGDCDRELELLLPFRGRFLLFYFSGNHDMKKKIRVSPI